MNSGPYIKLTCEGCNQKVYLQMYFNQPFIFDETRPTDLEHNYKAQVTGRGTCYNCGHQIDKLFIRHLSRADIINLAIKRSRAESHYVVDEEIKDD